MGNGWPDGPVPGRCPVRMDEFGGLRGIGPKIEAVGCPLRKRISRVLASLSTWEVGAWRAVAVPNRAADSDSKPEPDTPLHLVRIDRSGPA